MKKNAYLAVCIFIIMAYSPVYAALSGMTVLSITPPNPAPGDLVAVSFNYCTDVYDVSNLILAVSSYTTIQPDNTGGQQFKVNGNGMDLGGTGAGDAASNNAGFSMGDSQGTSHCQTTTWNIHIPDTFLEGTTYYIVVAGRAYDCRPGSIDTQNYLSFTTPPPATGCSITKSAEVSPVKPGELVMYTIDYNFANATNLIITDLVPANCTLVTQSTGGTNSGTTPGSTLSWALGDTVSRKSGKLWFIVRVDAAAPYSTAINGMAHWVINEIPAGGDSNDPTVMTTAPFTIVKSESVAAAAIGDTITYTIDFHSGGYGFSTYDTFDSDVSGFFAVSGGGTANPGIWTWMTSAGDGFLYSQFQGLGSYPRYLKSSASSFCFGEIQGDVYMGGTGYMDSLISFRDNGLADTMAFAYGIGVSSDHTPGDIYLQKAAPYTLLAFASPFSANSNTWYTVKIFVTDAGGGAVRIQAKAWPRGGIEPGTWAIDYTDNSGSIPACGFIGFQGHPDNINYYDNLKIISSNPTKPVVYDTIPTIITYVGGTAADTTHGPAVFAGGMVKWDIDTSLTDLAYSLTWWGTVNYCGDAFNTASYDTQEASPPVDSNTTSLNVAVCPQTPTITVTFTESKTSTMTYTRTMTLTSTLTHTLTQTLTSTRTFTPTLTATNTVTPTSTPTVTNTPIIPKFSLSKSVAPASAARGDTVTYTIHYENTGLIALTNFAVWDTLPLTLENVSNISNSGVYTSATNLINWLLPSVALNGSGDVSFTATLKQTVARNAVISNIASANVSGAASAVDSNQADVAAQVPLLDLTSVTNYPNPFDDTTTIVFRLTINAVCQMTFYTISGEKVRVVDNIAGTAGLNKVPWDGLNKSGNKLSSGIYIYKIKASAGNEEKKVMSRLAILR